MLRRPLASSICIVSVCVLVGLAASLGTSPIERLDRQSVVHVMPALPSVAYYGFNSAGQPALVLLPKHPRLARQAHFVWGPFARLFSSVAVAGLCLYAFWRRRERVRPLGWLLGFGLGNLVAFALQDLVRRPDIVIAAGALRYPVTGYEASFPSGYAFRAVFLAVMVCALWRRAVVLVAPVLAFVIAAIVAGGSHLPTDVAAATALAAGSYIISAAIATSAPVRSLLQRPRIRQAQASRSAT